MADTLVGRLCRAMLRLRERWRQLHAQQVLCQEASLRTRLASEQDQVLSRRRELQRVARAMAQGGQLHDALGRAFLRELTRRFLTA
jgi:hypothetical protein